MSEFWDHLKELETTIGRGHTKIQASVYSDMAVWIKPCGLTDKSNYLNLIDIGDKATGLMQCLFSRAMDENGKLLFDTAEKRQQALDSTANSAFAELAQLILTHDNKVAHKSGKEYAKARKNSMAQPGNGSTA